MSFKLNISFYKHYNQKDLFKKGAVIVRNKGVKAGFPDEYKIGLSEIYVYETNLKKGIEYFLLEVEFKDERMYYVNISEFGTRDEVIHRDVYSRVEQLERMKGLIMFHLKVSTKVSETFG